MNGGIDLSGYTDNGLTAKETRAKIECILAKIGTRGEYCGERLDWTEGFRMEEAERVAHNYGMLALLRYAALTLVSPSLTYFLLYPNFCCVGCSCDDMLSWHVANLRAKTFGTASETKQPQKGESR